MSRTKAILPAHPLTSKLTLLLPQVRKSNSLPVKTLKLTFTLSLSHSAAKQTISTGPAAPGSPSLLPDCSNQRHLQCCPFTSSLLPTLHQLPLPSRDWPVNILPKSISNDSRAPHTHTPGKLRSSFQSTTLEH